MFYKDVQAVVVRAAELLPEPPRASDPDGCARWEALLMDTGRQLAEVLDADIDLLLSLMGEEGALSVACGQRRLLLLRLALCSTREMSKPKVPSSGARFLQLGEGSIDSKTTVEVPRRLTLHPGSPGGWL